MLEKINIVESLLDWQLIMQGQWHAGHCHFQDKNAIFISANVYMSISSATNH